MEDVNHINQTLIPRIEAEIAKVETRVEIHLSNGAELGLTTPVNVAPGQTIDIRLPAAGQSFETWSTHAEVG